MADTPPIFSHCPNCGTAWPDRANACPHCGFVRPGVPAWPPPLTGFIAPSPLVPRLVTKAVWADLTLGIGVSLLSNFVFGMGFILMPILYFSLRPQYPVFARGIGYGFLASAAMLLGAIGWCFYSVFKNGH